MKKIIKEIKKLMKFYESYRLIVTNIHIELKITPKLDAEKETNWTVCNSKDGKMELLLSLQDLSSEYDL